MERVPHSGIETHKYMKVLKYAPGLFLKHPCHRFVLTVNYSDGHLFRSENRLLHIIKVTNSAPEYINTLPRYILKRRKLLYFQIRPGSSWLNHMNCKDDQVMSRPHVVWNYNPNLMIVFDVCIIQIITPNILDLRTESHS